MPNDVSDSLFDGTIVEPWADDPYDAQDESPPSSFRSFLQSTDWTVGTILDQIDHGNIDLNPQFQRRTVWTVQRMSRYIESLIIGLPVPQLVFAAEKSARGKFIVLDGKQRLTSLERFFKSDSSDAPMRLRGLTLRPDLEGVTFDDLGHDPDLIESYRSLMNATIRTVSIHDWSDVEYLSIVFHRLNTGSVALASQELRQALYPGPFSTRLDAYAADSQNLHRALRTDSADFRMRDTELALRFVSFSLRLPMYSGNLKTFLDDTTLSVNADWDAWRDRVEVSLDNLEHSLATALEVFGEDAFRRYRGGRYESLFNRAIFDVQSFYFAVPEYRVAALSAPAAVKQAFEGLIDGDVRFVEAISSTTKSLDNTAYRLSAWGVALQRALGLNGPIPRIGNDRRIAWIS